MTIEFTAPIRIESEMNKREHWTARKKRFDAQRTAVRRMCGAALAKADADYWRGAIRGPLAVTLTRIGPRTLDSDNLAGGFKAVRDQVAYMLWLDDGDALLTWVYAQEKGKPKEYSIRVRIESSKGKK